jgi:nucleoside-diphosphate-sugar epimerase
MLIMTRLQIVQSTPEDQARGMKIFVTGATGFVGSAIVRELLSAGHRVLGLVRSDAGAHALTEEGAEAHRGSITDRESLQRGAAGADAVIHTAFNHDFSRFAASCAEDKQAIEALGDVLAGSARPLVVTSALGVLPPGVLGTEDMPPASGAAAHPRAATEHAAQALAERGVRVSLVRLPPSTHGDGDPHFAATLVRLARETGVAAYVDDGTNRWPAVHRLDAASLFRLVVERGAERPRYHAVAEEGIPLRDIARVIGARLGVPIVSKTGEEALRHFGGFARFISLNVPATSQETRAALGWAPTRVGLLEDLERGRYFDPPLRS